MVTQASITISCQKCGGVSNVVDGQEYHRCQYCSSLIQLKEVSVDRILPTGLALDCFCPTCSQSMQTGLVENRRVLYCAACFGVLVRHQDFGSIVQERQARRVGIEPAEPRPIDPAAYQRKLDCPSCRHPMEVHPYYGPGNIVVDSCAECGYIWLDHGEITRVEQASALRPTNPVTWSGDVRTTADRLYGDASADSQEEAHDNPLRSLADLLFLGIR